jgi:phosphatidylglycerophosphate synthase
MRKIPARYENPFDNVIISHIDSIQSRFFKLGFTPNILTTISLVCHLYAMYFFVNNKEYYTVYSVIFFFLSYYFDCFDGHFARSYGMVTRFGDYYDHIGDWSKNILFGYLIYTYYNPYFYASVAVLVIFAVLSIIHLSCQEHYYGKHVSETFHLLKYICPSNYFNGNDCLNITKYVGCGTYLLIAVIIIIYLKTAGIQDAEPNPETKPSELPDDETKNKY